MFVRLISALFLAWSLIAVNAQSQCNRGECISLYRCPSVLQQLKGQLSTTAVTYLRSLQCESGIGEYPHVCCVVANLPQSQPQRQPPLPTSTQPTLASRFPAGRGNVLPSQCPVSTSENVLGDRIVGGIDAQLEDFPWTVLLEYETRFRQKKLSCGGSLISPRYVVTAAHCLAGEIMTKIGKLVGVRLGEYDITKDIDCIGSKCADPIISMGVEEIIPHPNYMEKSMNRYNDIGLVRMDGDVTYTDYIKPICLPSTANYPHSYVNDILASSGWGRTLANRNSVTKQKIYLPLYDHAKCSQQYRVNGIVVDDTQMCAGGIEQQDTCNGDSGNALLKIASSSWIIEGVVSYGLRCGLRDTPAVYTRVSSFEPWIRSTLRP